MMDDEELYGLEEELHEWIGKRTGGDLPDAIVVLARAFITAFAIFVVKTGVDPTETWNNNLKTMTDSFWSALTKTAMDERDDEERVN